jgi:predicted dehydrogenase
MKKLKWGIIGSGSITHAFVKGLVESETGELNAVSSRTQESSDQWGEKHNLPKGKCYSSYTAMLADEEIDAVYVALLNNRHCELTVQAAEAGKHILCEKPLAMNHSEVMVMLEACRANKVFLMEAFMWRCHPGTAEWLKLIREGVIGDVRLIEAQFSFNMNGNPTSTRMINKLGGGGIMDVGCYTVSAARAIAGNARGKDFAEPIDMQGYGHVGETGVDEWATVTMRFPGDVLANLSCGVQLSQHNQIRIYGSKGNMIVQSPWFADGKAIINLGGESREVAHSSPKSLYTHEVDMLGRCVREGRLEAYAPAMTWADSLGQQLTLDRWRKAVGVVFEGETLDKPPNTLPDQGPSNAARENS